MPAIQKNDKQLIALQEIEGDLAMVKQLNVAMGENVPIQVVASPAQGKPIKVEIPVEETKAVIAAVGRVRAKLVKNIRSKAAKFKIDLDDSDNAVLDAF